MTDAPQVRENPAQHRFELWVGDERAGVLVYQGTGDPLTFLHTVVDERFEGRGLGSTLIRGSLEAVRERGVRVLPVCPFVRAYLAKHPDYQDLVPAAERGRFGLPPPTRT